MSRVNARSIWEKEDTQAKLNEIQAGTVENLQKKGNSFKVKSDNANLDEKAGSYEFKRHQNSQSKKYGTARAAGKGAQLVAPPITVKVDTNLEIVEEITKFDADRFGIDAAALSIIEKRKANHEMTLKRDVEEEFWGEAYKSAVAGDDLNLKGTVLAGIDTASTTPVDEQLETAIVSLETTRNNYVNGVDRENIAGFLRPGVYSKLKSRLNTMFNANFSVADEELQGINGVALFSELYLPKKVDYIVLVKGSVAQPLSIDQYQGDRIPLSNDFAVELFYDFGTKALSADLIVVGIETDATHTKVKSVAALPSTYADVAEDTIYIATTAITIGVGEDAVTYAIGDMFTATKTAPSTVAWAQYNA